MGILERDDNSSIDGGIESYLVPALRRNAA